MRDAVTQLRGHGFVVLDAHFGSRGVALRAAQNTIDACSAAAFGDLALIGDFVLPPPDGPPSRGFQTLHFDFGVPLDPKSTNDMARFTALHVPAERAGVDAVTRLVPLAELLAQRSWPARPELVRRLVSYGVTHGAWPGAVGYVEGSLARIVEAAAGRPALPSVKADPQFLCGTEFDSLTAEQRFFALHGVPLDTAEIEIALRPGEVLVFDNLAVAHGRRGSRSPGELRQWVFGHRGLGSDGQRALRDTFLRAFASPEPALAPIGAPGLPAL